MVKILSKINTRGPTCMQSLAELDESVPLRSATRTKMKLNVISREKGRRYIAIVADTA